MYKVKKSSYSASGFEEVEISKFIEDELDEDDYESGKIERIGYKQDRIIDYLARLTDLLINKKILTKSQAEELLGQDLVGE